MQAPRGKGSEAGNCAPAQLPRSTDNTKVNLTSHETLNVHMKLNKLAESLGEAGGGGEGREFGAGSTIKIKPKQ